MPQTNPTPSIAYASLNTGSADVLSAAPPPPAHPANPVPNNPQSAIRNPQSLDLSSPAGMDRARLAAAYIETDLITSCEKRRALDPSSPAFDASLREDAKILTSVLSARKTIITLDEHLQHRAAQLERYAAEVAQCEADQARLAADAATQEELHRQALARAQELLTQLAAEDPAFARALAKAGADLAAEFARLRDPEQISPAQAQKQIDDEARRVAYQLLNTLRNDHPYSGVDPSRHADAADRLARAQRGEPVPVTADPDDEDDDWDDDEDDFDDDDDFTGSADVSSATAADNECGDEDWDTPEWDDEAVARRERAASLGPRTASSAPPPSHAHSAPLSPLTPFNPQTAINSGLRPATPTEQQTTTHEPSSNPQSTIRNCTVPVCPTLSPRRLEAFLLSNAPNLDAFNAAEAQYAQTGATPQTVPAPEEPAGAPAPETQSEASPDAAPTSSTIDVERSTSRKPAHPFAHVLNRARARPGF